MIELLFLVPLIWLVGGLICVLHTEPPVNDFAMYFVFVWLTGPLGVCILLCLWTVDALRELGPWLYAHMPARPRDKRRGV